MTSTRFLNVRSSDRDSGTATSFKYTLPTPIHDPIQISLVSAEIPLQHYNIRTNYNTFTWTQSSTQYTATVTSGNYAISDLLTALASAMNTATGSTYTVTKSSTTLKITLACATSMTLSETNLSKALGFTSGQSGTSITATNSYCINTWDSYWALCIRNLTNNYISKGVYPTFKIPITVDSGYVLYHLENLTFFQYFIPETAQIGHLDVYLQDSYGNQVDLNGLEWSFTLKVESAETY